MGVRILYETFNESKVIQLVVFDRKAKQDPVQRAERFQQTTRTMANIKDFGWILAKRNLRLHF